MIMYSVRRCRASCGIVHIVLDMYVLESSKQWCWFGPADTVLRYPGKMHIHRAMEQQIASGSRSTAGRERDGADEGGRIEHTRKASVWSGTSDIRFRGALLA